MLPELVSYSSSASDAVSEWTENNCPPRPSVQYLQREVHRVTTNLLTNSSCRREQGTENQYQRTDHAASTSWYRRQTPRCKSTDRHGRNRRKPTSIEEYRSQATAGFRYSSLRENNEPLSQPESQQDQHVQKESGQQAASKELSVIANPIFRRVLKIS